MMGKHPLLPEVAARAGYADQAHMTRDVQRMSGSTPSEFIGGRKSNLADLFNTAGDPDVYFQVHVETAG